jgi:hypothetical protein
MRSGLNRRDIKLRHDEAGYALMWVLVVIILAGIILVPLLLLMTSGLHSSAHHEERMLRFYATDAGIEDAAYRIQNDDPNLPPNASDVWSYTLDEEVNDYQVDVTIENFWILTGLESEAFGTMPHAELVVVGTIPEDGEYYVEFTYDGSVGNLKIDRVGAWLPSGYSYVPDSSDGIVTHSKIPDNPDEFEFRGGTALTWDFNGTVDFEDMPPPGGGEPGSAEFPITRVLSFQYTPSSPDPKGLFSWIRTNRHDIYLSWDTACGTYQVTSTAGETTVESYIVRAKPYGRISEIYGDYRAIGQSLMYDASGSWDDWWDSGIRDTLRFGSASLEAEVDDIPDDATIVLAYLYWSAWRRDPNNITSYDEDELAELAEEIDEAEFKAPGMSSAEWLTADRIQIRQDELTGSPHGWSYSCRADVTDLITGNGNGDYRVREIEGITDDDTGDHLSYAGWSVMLVYSSAEEQAHQLYLYDDFARIEGYTTTVLEGIEGFLAPSDSDARLTIFVGEGDDIWNGDKVQFNDNYLPYFGDPYDGVNPQNDVMNGRSSGLDGEFIDGVDIDTFDTSPYVDAGDTSAEVKLITDIDHWNLVYVMLSFRTVPGTEAGLYPVGLVTYSYDSY